MNKAQKIKWKNLLTNFENEINNNIKPSKKIIDFLLAHDYVDDMSVLLEEITQIDKKNLFLSLVNEQKIEARDNEIMQKLWIMAFKKEDINLFKDLKLIDKDNYFFITHLVFIKEKGPLFDYIKNSNIDWEYLNKVSEEKQITMLNKNIFTFIENIKAPYLMHNLLSAAIYSLDVVAARKYLEKGALIRFKKENGYHDVLMGRTVLPNSKYSNAQELRMLLVRSYREEDKCKNNETWMDFIKLICEEKNKESELAYYVENEYININFFTEDYQAKIFPYLSNKRAPEILNLLKENLNESLSTKLYKNTIERGNENLLEILMKSNINNKKYLSSQHFKNLTKGEVPSKFSGNKQTQIFKNMNFLRSSVFSNKLQNTLIKETQTTLPKRNKI